MVTFLGKLLPKNLCPANHMMNGFSGLNFTCKTADECTSNMLATMVETLTMMPLTPMSDGMCQTGYKLGCYEGQCGLTEVHPAYVCLSEEEFVLAGEGSEDVDTDSDCVDDTTGYEYEDYEDYYQAIDNDRTNKLKCNHNLCPVNSSCSSCQFCLPQRHLGSDIAGGRVLSTLSAIAGSLFIT